MDLLRILSRASKYWDGGYVMAGLLGHGDAFVLRDPWGIRPAYFYRDDEIVVVASERPVIQTTLNVKVETIEEIEPGNALIIRRNGEVGQYECRHKNEKRSCSFERIYFSRGTDKDIYQERKKLGKNLAPAILKSIDYDLQNTVFSYIPNTAAVAFRGLVQELLHFINTVRKEKIMLASEAGNINQKFLDDLFTDLPRVEKIAVKDVKLRTFIAEDKGRDDLVTHVYDVTYGVVRSWQDNLVVVDDSIVRGTTIKRSIISILDRLEPKKIIIASSAPQLRYPDCYGIDMAKLSDFVAFKAAIELLRENHLDKVINEVYIKCKKQENYPKEKIVNYIKEIYKPFSAEQISARIAKMVTPSSCKSQVEIIYQTIENLHDACPNDRGDWYFTGNYPTPGGNKVVNKSFINYIEGKNERAY
jgi:amidophosphoribosyltransferase